MDSRTYLAQSERTLSHAFHTELVPLDELRTAMTDAAAAAQRLDVLKKSLYYGKPRADIPMSASEDIPATLDPVLLHGVIGIFTEAGELIEALLKGVDGTAIDMVNLREELGDVEWYMAILYRALDSLPEDVRAVNIAKLRARYPEKFTAQAAINRDIDAERRILEAKAAE